MAAEATVRSSGRVRKQPELYGTKRKHTEDEEDSDETSEDSGDEDVYAERRASTQRATRGQQTQPKRTKTQGTTLAIRTSSKDTSLRSIFGEDGPDTIVSQWLAKFEAHESSALAEFINYILRAAGCSSSVTAQQIEDPDSAISYITDIIEEFQASNPTDYPMMAKGRQATTVKQGVARFIDVFCKSTVQSGLLFENVNLMENIHIWLSTMSTAANRAFRHTSTVVSLFFMTALCDCARELEDETAKSQKQLDNESKKSTKNKARITEFQKKVSDASKREERVLDMVRDWYDTVFIHRYKDVDPATRQDCATAIGTCIYTLPNNYLDSQHLRYLGWMLCDPVASVRHECIKQLLRLYKVPDLCTGMGVFTEKFRARMVEMATSDSETSVRIMSIELLDILRDAQNLDPAEVDVIGHLIFEFDDKVRKAAAKFFAEGIKSIYDIEIEKLGSVEALEDAMPSDGPQLAWLKLKFTATTLQAYHTGDQLPDTIDRSRFNGELMLNAAGSESRFTLAANDLRQRMPELDDWRTLMDYLLYDLTQKRTKRKTNDILSNFKATCHLSDNEETILLHVLYVAVRNEVAHHSQELKTASKSKKLEIQEDLDSSIRDLVANIPKLLEKYGHSPEATSAVLRLAEILDVEGATSASTYEGLLEQAKRQFLSHTDDKVLSAAIQIFSKAKSQGDLDEVITEHFSTMWEAVILDIVQLIGNNAVNQRGTKSAEDMQRLTETLTRMLHLSRTADCIPPLEDETTVSDVLKKKNIKAPIDIMLALMDRAQTVGRNVELNHLEDRAALIAAKIGLNFLRWHYLSLKQRVIDAVDISIDELHVTAGRQDLYSDILTAVMQGRKAKSEIVVEYAGLAIEYHLACMTLSAIDRAPGVADDYMVFVQDIHTQRQDELIRAFVGAEAVYANLAKKKLEPAPVDSQDEPEIDDFDEDPESDEDDEDEDTPEQAEARQSLKVKKAEEKLILTLMAEQRLCVLVSKLTLAVLAGLLNKAKIKARVERNVKHLGNNFKEACKFFDLDAKEAKKLRSKHTKATVALLDRDKAKKAGRGRKAHAVDAESEVDDEIEDGEEEEDLRRRELIDNVDDDEPMED